LSISLNPKERLFIGEWKARTLKSDWESGIPKPVSVIAMSGWKNTFILNDEYITMLSRYPDQDFYK